jgi:hypothetical protein
VWCGEVECTRLAVVARVWCKWEWFEYDSAMVRLVESG